MISRLYEFKYNGESFSTGTVVSLKDWSLTGRYGSNAVQTETRVIYKWTQVGPNEEYSICVEYSSGTTLKRSGFIKGNDFASRFLRVEEPNDFEKERILEIFADITREKASKAISSKNAAKWNNWENNRFTIFLLMMLLILAIVFVPVIGIPIMLWILFKKDK